MWETVTAFSVMQLVLHFALFIMAWIGRSHRRRDERKIIYLVAAPGTADGRTYYDPPAQLSQGNMGSVANAELSHHHR